MLALIAPGMIQVCLCMDSTTKSKGFGVFDAARARRRSAACFTYGCSGIVDIAEGVDGIRAIEARDVTLILIGDTEESGNV